MTLALTKKSETSSKITLGWTPVPGAVGYRFQSATQAPKWSHTWDATQDQVTFSKAAWYKVEALGVESAGQYPATGATGATGAPGHAIPARSVSMPAGGLAHWIHYNSPTTQIVSTDGNNFRQRVVNWDPAGGKSPAYYLGKTTYCIIGYRMVTGSPGVFLDWHNMADDQPWGWTPPYKPGGTRTAVSPVALDCWGNDGRGTILRVQSEKDMSGGTGGIYTIFTPAQTDAHRGSWVWLWLRIDWGRSDTLPDGRAQVWVAGEDNSPRVDAQNINTHAWEQHMLSCFQGCYWSSKTGPAITIEHAAMRFGRTPQECYEDVPVYHADSTYSPPGSSTAIPPRQSTEAAIPADLRW